MADRQEILETIHLQRILIPDLRRVCLDQAVELPLRHHKDMEVKMDTNGISHRGMDREDTTMEIKVEVVKIQVTRGLRGQISIMAAMDSTNKMAGEVSVTGTTKDKVEDILRGTIEVEIMAVDTIKGVMDEDRPRDSGQEYLWNTWIADCDGW